MANLISWKKSMFNPSHHLRRKDPFAALQTELDRAMVDFYNFFGMHDLPMGDFKSLTISPSVDIVEDENSFKIEAEMPGLGEGDININISDGQLTIKGEKHISKQDEGKNYIAREIGYGSYERTIALPNTVDIDKAKASFKKGMLWINIPKKAEAVQHNREIKVEKVS